MPTEIKKHCPYCGENRIDKDSSHEFQYICGTTFSRLTGRVKSQSQKCQAIYISNLESRFGIKPQSAYKCKPISLSLSNYEEQNNRYREVVRLKHIGYRTARGEVHLGVVLYPQKRKSLNDYLPLQDWIDNCGEDTIKWANNIYCLDEGLYEVLIVNESRDWEMGYVDDWELHLAPYEEKKDEEESELNSSLPQN